MARILLIQANLMARISSPVITAIIICLASYTVVAQQILTSDLIAWTDMETPQPIPQALPHTKSAPAGPLAQTFTGTVTQQGTSCFLKVSDQEYYELDQVNEPGRYHGRQVVVLGALQPGTTLIHIFRIEPIS